MKGGLHIPEKAIPKGIKTKKMEVLIPALELKKISVFTTVSFTKKLHWMMNIPW